MAKTPSLIWIVDDDQSIRWVLEKALSREKLPYRSFSSAEKPLALLEEEAPAVLLSDVRMPGISGLTLLQQLKTLHPDCPVILMTAYADLKSTMNAFEYGAYDYLPKPFDIAEAVAVVRRAYQRPKALEDDKAEEEVHLPGILGHAPAMQVLFRAMGRLVHSDATVLITGESGTGKELVASALHHHGPRRQAPFIAINSASIPRDLLESELFGHEKGAFTGAIGQRIGRFQQAEGGTLFLDEIGDMPLDLQARLLRVLSDHQYYRVGGQTPLKANVRIIAATHQNLEQNVREKTFREDLLYRLNVIRLRLPPLRERREDIPLLARYFLQEDAKDSPAKKLSADAEHYLQIQDFPGNVRQLKNLCHWLNVMVPSAIIEVGDLPTEWPTSTEMPGTEDWLVALGREMASRVHNNEKNLYPRLLEEFEKVLLTQALKATRQHRQEAAALLGIGRNTLARKLKTLGFPSGS